MVSGSDKPFLGAKPKEEERKRGIARHTIDVGNAGSHSALSGPINSYRVLSAPSTPTGCAHSQRRKQSKVIVEHKTR